MSDRPSFCFPANAQIAAIAPTIWKVEIALNLMTTTQEMLNTIGSWIRSQLNLTQVEETTASNRVAIAAVLERLGNVERLLSVQLTNQEQMIMALPEIIKTAIATEFQEGQKFVTLNEELKAQIAELEKRPNLAADEAVVNIKELAEQISQINPTPVGDAIVEAVKEDPAIETPPVVESAPETAPDVIQQPPVVESAIDALSETPEGSSPGI